MTRPRRGRQWNSSSAIRTPQTCPIGSTSPTSPPPTTAPSTPSASCAPEIHRVRSTTPLNHDSRITALSAHEEDDQDVRHPPPQRPRRRQGRLPAYDRDGGVHPRWQPRRGAAGTDQTACLAAQWLRLLPEYACP